MKNAMFLAILVVFSAASGLFAQALPAVPRPAPPRFEQPAPPEERGPAPEEPGPEAVPFPTGPQAGSVAIAGQIGVAEALLKNPVDCLTGARQAGLNPGNAAKYCKDMAKIGSETAKAMAGKSAKAANASQPRVVAPYYGGYYGTGYYGISADIGWGGGYYRSFPAYRSFYGGSHRPLPRPRPLPPSRIIPHR